MINEDFWFVVLTTKKKRIYIFAKSCRLLLSVVEELNKKHSFSCSKPTTIRNSELAFERFYMQNRAKLVKHNNFAVIEA